MLYSLLSVLTLAHLSTGSHNELVAVVVSREGKKSEKNSICSQNKANQKVLQLGFVFVLLILAIFSEDVQ